MGLRSAHAACLVAAVLCFRPARSNGDVAAEEDMMLAGAGYDTSDMPNVLTKVDCVYTDPLTQKRWDLTDMDDVRHSPTDQLLTRGVPVVPHQDPLAPRRGHALGFSPDRESAIGWIRNAPALVPRPLARL